MRTAAGQGDGRGGKKSKRRSGVSAEPLANTEQQKAPTKSRRRVSVGGDSDHHSRRMSCTDADVAQFFKSKESMEILERATKNNLLFEPLDPAQRKMVFGAMVDQKYEAGDIVIQQGERGDIFYVVESGAFEASIKSSDKEPAKKVAFYESGTGFGELALLYNGPRAATIKCTKPGKCWGIERGLFNMIMVSANKTLSSSTKEFLNSISLFEPLSDKQVDVLVGLFTEFQHPVGEVLFEAGEACETLYLIRDGEVELYGHPEESEALCPSMDEDKRAPGLRRSSISLSKKIHETGTSLLTLGRGDFIGAAALEGVTGVAKLGRRNLSIERATTRSSLKNSAIAGPTGPVRPTYKVHGRALSQVTVLELTRNTLQAMNAERIGDLPTALLKHVQSKAVSAARELLGLDAKTRVRALAGLPALKIAADGFLESDAPAPGDESSRRPSIDGEGFEEDLSKRRMQLVVSGAAKAEHMDGEGDAKQIVLGEPVDKDAFSEKTRPRMKLSSAVPGREILVVELNADLLVSLRAKIQRITAKAEQGESNKSLISLDELNQVAVLGAGGYGHVCLVEHKATSTCFALKKMSKPHVVYKKQVDHVNNERKLLAKSAHPFIIGLFGSFQDESYLYLLLELVLGGELWSYLNENGPVGIDGARFYGGMVQAALEYLHDHEIVYRDLKPENLLIDRNGFIKVCDFGFAKVVFPGDRTWTLCGTPEYLAPEIILRKGTTSSADWWSFGILVVELITGSTPFVSDDDFSVFKKIVKAEVDWNQFRLPPIAKALVELLLVKDPSMRLGSRESGGAHKIRSENFFKPLDFEKLQKRELSPPWVPVVDNDKDTRHCCEEDEIELPEPDEKALRAVEGQGKDLFDLFPEFERVADVQLQ